MNKEKRRLPRSPIAGDGKNVRLSIKNPCFRFSERAETGIPVFKTVCKGGAAVYSGFDSVRVVKSSLTMLPSHIPSMVMGVLLVSSVSQAV